jgi:seryl-tRNA synthetase
MKMNDNTVETVDASEVVVVERSETREPANVVERSETQKTEVSKSSVNKSKLVALFNRYDEIDTEIEECKAKVERLTRERNTVVEEMYVANGNQAALMRGGRRMSIVINAGKGGNANWVRGAREEKKEKKEKSDITSI